MARAVTDLPLPDSPDQRDGLALVQGEGDVLHGLDLAAVDLEGDADVPGFDGNVTGHGVTGHVRPQYGSTASRRPSPSALKAKTARRMKPTGDRIQG